MIKSTVAEQRALTAAQVLESKGHAMLFCSKAWRKSSEWDRDNKGRRQPTEYMDRSGAKVDLNGLLARAAFSIDREPNQESLKTKANSVAPKEKSERKLLPKLSSLKRRRRSTALYLLAEVETAKETAS